MAAGVENYLPRNCLLRRSFSALDRPWEALDCFSLFWVELDIFFKDLKSPPVTSPAEVPNLSLIPRCYIPKALMSFRMIVMNKYSTYEEGLEAINKKKPNAMATVRVKAALTCTAIFQRLDNPL